MLVRRALLNMSYLNYGNIVIISSSAAFQTLPNIASYAASKMAIKSLGEALVVENENKNIKYAYNEGNGSLPVIIKKLS